MHVAKKTQDRKLLGFLAELLIVSVSKSDGKDIAHSFKNF